MKTSYYLLIIALFILSTTGCEDNGLNSKKVVGTGPIITETLDLSSFDKIQNLGVADFYITIGSPQSVELKAQQNIIDVMTYQVSDQTLKVSLEENVSIESYEEIRFDITIPSISSIHLAGVGDFELSGDVQEELTIGLTGVGNIEAYAMKVETCTISSVGVGNCEVHVLNEFTVTISGVGDVYYRGNPTINSTVTGVGALIDAN